MTKGVGIGKTSAFMVHPTTRKGPIAAPAWLGVQKNVHIREASRTPDIEVPTAPPAILEMNEIEIGELARALEHHARPLGAGGQDQCK